MSQQYWLVTLVVTALFSTSSVAKGPEKTPTWTDPAVAMKEDASFKYQGEYVAGDKALQVVPEQGKFYVSYFNGGLPGAGWDGKKTHHERLSIKGLIAVLKPYRKVDRGVKVGMHPAPKNAIVIFDGKKSKELKGGKIIDRLLMAGVKSARDYRDFTLHFEFRTPYKPELPVGNPDRGNSGIYLLGHYEIQIADCFGLSYDEKIWKQEKIMKYPSTCNGAIYTKKAPDVNMSLPSLMWQSYDIEFTAARFEAGKKVKNARISLIHNGVKVHNNIEVDSGTGSKSKLAEVATGPLYFQNHHNPVQYRNIWLVEK